MVKAMQFPITLLVADLVRSVLVRLFSWDNLNIQKSTHLFSSWVIF